MRDKNKFALLPKVVYVIGMKDEHTISLIWLKRYYISQESEYESLNGETIQDGTEYIYPSQAKFTFLSLIKLGIFSGFILFLYIVLRELF